MCYPLRWPRWPQGAATGSVTFKDGAGVLAGNVPLTNGTSASFSTSALAVGTHAIKAIYSGDAAYNPSASAAISVIVSTNLTTLTAASNLNPAAAFQPFNLSAQLSSSTSANLPAGAVTFSLNGIAVGTVPIGANGAASLPLTLAAGSYSVSTSFAATAGFVAAQSPTFVQPVVADHTGTTLT